jgi:hypothetical protein
MSLKAAAVSQVARHKPDRTCPSKPATLRQIAWHAPEIDVSLGLPQARSTCPAARVNCSPEVGLRYSVPTPGEQFYVCA